MIRVQAAPFDIGAELTALTDGRTDIGGLVSFTGLVRDFADGPGLTAMTLEHYPGMTEKSLKALEDEAVSRFDLKASLIIHRVGRLEPGEPIVLVAAAAPHRRAAFDAADFMMDTLKTTAPFWKKEDRGGNAAWVDAREMDRAAARRWMDT